MNEKLRVLIADDEPMVCVVVKKFIGKNWVWSWRGWPVTDRN